ncbi:MAG TPA: carboxypeptidase-like regulatory domain-containing protein, partial [Solirubrobacteraceae bacterium]|nr:carboxypeptidase-like regulatory domain-containing protein [Solirubrobacteraceae bacterium]
GTESGKDAESGTGATSTATAAPAPGSPNGTHASPNARLVVKLTDDRTTRRVAYGKKATIRGTLADESGRPVAGATLTVTSRVRRTGAKPQRKAPVTTNARGEFTLTVPKGPSRDLTFGYRAFTAATDLTATKTVTVLVASKLTLKATPRRLRNRQRVRFSGTVQGKPTAKHGPLVDLQVLVDGTWRSFLKGAVRADRNGRFTASYRFLRTTRPATYTFRAVARQDSAYPYVANASPRITVRVRP